MDDIKKDIEKIDLISYFVDGIDTSENVKEILKKIFNLNEDSQKIIGDIVIDMPLTQDDINIIRSCYR